MDNQTCRVCGCTDERACLDPRDGLPCFWVENDLCSTCLGKPQPAPWWVTVLLVGCVALGVVGMLLAAQWWSGPHG